MTTLNTLLCLSGSLQSSSKNTLLLHHAATKLAAPQTQFGNLNLPLYNGDLEKESSLPQEVLELHERIKTADAILISTPEYNKGLSGVLKNALDWVSRAGDNPWAGKPVAVMACAAGRSGGERALTMLINCLVPFQPNLITGPELLVAQNHLEFDDLGHLKSDHYNATLETLLSNLRSSVSTG